MRTDSTLVLTRKIVAKTSFPANIDGTASPWGRIILYHWTITWALVCAARSLCHPSQRVRPCSRSRRYSSTNRVAVHNSYLDSGTLSLFGLGQYARTPVRYAEIAYTSPVSSFRQIQRVRQKKGLVSHGVIVGTFFTSTAYRNGFEPEATALSV